MPVWKLQSKYSGAPPATDWPCPNRLRTRRADIGAMRVKARADFGLGDGDSKLFLAVQAVVGDFHGQYLAETTFCISRK
jgi:hypothetical protein